MPVILNSSLNSRRGKRDVRMNHDELRAMDYLRSLQLGNVVYEPEGKTTPPDFSIGTSIAIEVRRLNQNYKLAGKLRGLEEDRIPITQRFSELVAAFEPPLQSKGHIGSWFVFFNIRRRPIESWKVLARNTREALTSFCLSDCSMRTFTVTPNFEINLEPAEARHDTSFLLGGFSDFDQNGFVLPKLLENITLCLDAKSEVFNRLEHYQERWLLLVDYIGYGRRECLAVDKRGWNKLILLSPEANLLAYEPE
jgi:hypothetical protein